MDSQNWQRVKDIFAEALDEPKENRLDFLRARCGADAELFAEVESLLEAAGDDTEPLLERNALQFATRFDSGKRYDFTKFGRYTVLREIGRGGMGAVFYATRNDGEFEQRAALKIIRQSFTGEEIERHFRRERQILASLNHPNIAQLLDGGVSETGELFLVMEYVEGEPLLDYAVSRQLPIDEKLRLFLKICRAVSYAHQNLVVHRDLKPSNILVTTGGEPKLLDFGLAKITAPIDDGENDFETTNTLFRAFTPAYASPEQIQGKTVTTASDVYSLGVCLYELVTGDKPFHFEGKSLDEILKTVESSEPPRPSSAAAKLEEQKSKRAKEAKENLPLTFSSASFSLFSSSKIRGDLDNIILTALRKEPARRYKSVEALADDIERHLKNLPVAARPNTFQYRAAKFVRRNRIAVAAAALIFIVFVVGATVSFVQYRRAVEEKEKAEEVKNFLQKMLLTANPTDSAGDKKGYSTSMNDMLEQAARKLDGEDLSDQPEVRAELAETIGATYLSQGQYDLSEKYLRLALTAKTEIHGANSPELTKPKILLANFFFVKSNYDEAEKIYESNLPTMRAQFADGKIDVTQFVDTLDNYALLRRARGDSRQAETLLRESLAVGRQNPVPAANLDSIEILLTLTLLDQGKFEEAETSVRMLVAQAKRDAPDDATAVLANKLTLLGSVLMEKGNLTEAAAHLREAETIYRRIFSPNAIAVFDNLRLQAQVSYLAGNYAEAERQINQVLENYRQNSNPKYINFATALTVQGLTLNRLGKRAEAEQILREAAKLRRENLPAGHFMTALTIGALGEILLADARYAEAEPLLVKSYADLKSSQATENPRTTLAKRRLAELYTAWEKPEMLAQYR